MRRRYSRKLPAIAAPALQSQSREPDDLADCVAGQLQMAHPGQRSPARTRSFREHLMQVNRTRSIAAVVGIGAFCYVGQAQSEVLSTRPAVVASNDLQRSVGIYGYNVAANSGPMRGEVLYYYKYWFCHNDYAREAGSLAPGLKDIFKRATLVTGEPVNDDTVAKHIRNGSPQMPAFGTTLKDAEIAGNAGTHQSSRWPERNRSQRRRPIARRHYGAIDRAQRGAHHRLQQRGRTIRVSTARARLLYVAHRQAA